MNRKSYCIAVGIGSGISGGKVGISKMLKSFYIEVFYVMGKVLTDELSCTQTGFVVSGNSALNRP